MRTVETDIYTSWTQGQIYFKSETLENIIKKLARWYDLTVSYQDEEIKQLRFRGGINKKRSLEENLLYIEQTTRNIKFEINGKNVKVRKSES